MPVFEPLLDLSTNRGPDFLERLLEQVADGLPRRHAGAGPAPNIDGDRRPAAAAPIYAAIVRRHVLEELAKLAKARAHLPIQLPDRLGRQLELKGLDAPFLLGRQHGVVPEARPERLGKVAHGGD